MKDENQNEIKVYVSPEAEFKMKLRRLKEMRLSMKKIEKIINFSGDMGFRLPIINDEDYRVWLCRNDADEGCLTAEVQDRKTSKLFCDTVEQLMYNNAFPDYISDRLMDVYSLMNYLRP